MCVTLFPHLFPIWGSDHTYQLTQMLGGDYYPSLEKHYGNHALKVFEGTQLV